MTPVEGSNNRILVALDASPCSLAALEIAAQLAVALEAKLCGWYVEDESLIRGADLPFTKAIGSFSGAVREVERPELERHLRLQAAKARHAVATIAAHARLPWSFQVTRGGVAVELLLAAHDADLISLGRWGWSMIGSRRLGTTTRMILERTDAPVLLLGPRLHAGRSVVAIYDGTEASVDALRLAARIVHVPNTPLVIVLPATGQSVERLRQSAQTELDRLGVDRDARFRTIARPDAALLGGVVRGADAGILLLPTTQFFEKRLEELLTHLQCPLLVVKR